MRVADVPADVLDGLNNGTLATVNLIEFLALDLPRLALRVARDVGLDPAEPGFASALATLPVLKPMKRHARVALALYQATEAHAEPHRIARALATQLSDTARCWAAQWVGMSGLPLAGQLRAVERFAADPHFGVREIAWMALRDAVVGAPDEAIELLVPWTASRDENLRRFACELTRPRGVWCAQVEAFKNDPARALPLLEPLKADPSRYVQNSVANWLNDASKSQPAWVAALCERWKEESPTAPTRYVIQRALRTLAKK